MRSIIASKITVLSVVLIVITTAAVGGIFYYGIGRYLEKQKYVKVERQAEYLAPYLRKGLSELGQEVDFLATLPVIKKLLKKGLKAGENDFRIQLEHLFANLLKSKPHYVEIRLVDALDKMVLYDSIARRKREQYDRELEEFAKSYEGDLTSAIPPPPLVSQADINIASYLQDKVHLSKVRLEKFKKLKKELPVILGTRPIYDGKKLLGVLQITASLKESFNKLQKELSNPDAELYLTNEKGEFLVHPQSVKAFARDGGKDFRLQNEFMKSGQFFNSDELATTIEPGFLKSRRILHMSKIHFDKNDSQRFMVLGILVHRDQGVIEFNNSKKLMLTSSFVLIILAIFISYFFTARITRGLKKITAAAVAFTKGETDVKLEYKSLDEIGFLAKAFRQMIQRVEDRTKSIEKSKEINQKARISAEEANKEKLEMVAELKKQKRELVALHQEKDDLLAIVSHDLKNPLAVIETGSSILLDDEGDLGPQMSQKQNDMIRRIRSSSRIALNLITDILDMSQLEGGMKPTFEPFRFNDLVHESLDTFQFKAKEKNINLEYDVPANVDVLGDYGMVMQVISNIVGNAIKFTPEKGTISLKADVQVTQNEIDNSNKVLEIKISDTGIGIPQNKLKGIFNKYEQARSEDREIGTGLGLAICKKIVEMHNGTIRVDSIEGKGTTFTIQLPRVMAVQQTDNEIEASKFHEGENKILIVDDEPSILAVLKTHLEVCGYEVHTAEDGMKAMRKIRKLEPDLVLLDLEMPGLNGIQVLKRIRKTYGPGQLSVILHSSKITEDLMDSYREQVSGFIKKPARPKEVEEKVKAALSKEADLEHASRLFKLLIVDDSEDMQALYEHHLKKGQIELAFASNGKEGVELAKAQEFDLIFMDLNLPEMDGLQATSEVRNWEKEQGRGRTPVVAITADRGKDVVKKCKKVGCTAMMKKNFSKKELNVVLNKYLKSA